ncbi:phenylalanine--tRNA ligase subunit alpha [Kytococcus sedentarius]|uniref:phenylalanine--tRNA ligase subunit alpha n=1 Tax=Kytococcus sedentarius TaxID=1276 RepID=UPI00194EA374|nr:phenylalanine--tRNA ligase subunit alpha [Kytococcus sedentarius]QRO88245.1 phenylalanine--tRNA ligase subunit alpha [Kytococcus sedentarius]
MPSTPPPDESTPTPPSAPDAAPAITPEVVEEHVAAGLAAFEAASTLEELKTARLAHLGDKAPISLANRSIGGLPPQEKASAGKLVGMAKGRLSKALASREEVLQAERAEQILVEETVDVTAVPARRSVGSRHPVELIQQRMGEIFTGLGWEIAEGPEVEAEWFNFDALNFDADHPARAEADTFYVDPPERHLVVRTHTSPVQARSLLERGAPLYVAVPGKVGRTDEIDATHLPIFHQIEGLAVDKGLTMAHLRGTLDHFAKQLFGEGITTRLRPNFFPFTEPSAEMDFLCPVCRSEDDACRTCGGTGWIEWGGCGMVHPNVLRACGVDPEVYSGFAFGMGVERALIFRNGVGDLRDLIEGDVRFNTNFTVEV